MKKLSIVMMLGATLTAASLATASTPAEVAAKQAAQGAAAMQGGQYAKALEHYVVAYANESTPARLYDIASAYAALGRKQTAVQLYERIVALKKFGPEADAARAKIAALRAGGATAPPRTVKAPASVQVKITIIPMGAEVLVDGVAVGKAPLGPLALTPGTHRLEVRLNGYKTRVETLQVVAGTPLAKVITLSPGSGRVAGAPKPASPRTTGATSLAGKWFAASLEAGGRIQKDIRLNLTSARRGDMTVKTTTKLPRWRQKRCNATTLETITRYEVTMVKTAAGQKLAARNGRIAKCSCEGLCTSDDNLDFALMTTPNNMVMITQDFVMLRDSGTAAAAFRTRVGASDLAGAWQLQIGGSTEVGQLTLAASGNTVRGTMTMKTATDLPRWRQRQCNGDKMITATIHYTVKGVIRGGTVDLSFSKDRAEGCTCESACGIADRSIDTTRVQLTADGANLVGPRLLTTRK